jgi:hypothetical protein
VAICDQETLPSGEAASPASATLSAGRRLQGLLDTHTPTEINGMR